VGIWSLVFGIWYLSFGLVFCAGRKHSTRPEGPAINSHVREGVDRPMKEIRAPQVRHKPLLSEWLSPTRIAGHIRSHGSQEE
jgi:hypothetical protein